MKYLLSGLAFLLTSWLVLAQESRITNIYSLLDGNVNSVDDFLVSGLIIIGLCNMLYVYWTDFSDDLEIFKLEKDKLLRSKIEQKKNKYPSSYQWV